MPKTPPPPFCSSESVLFRTRRCAYYQRESQNVKAKGTWPWLPASLSLSFSLCLQVGFCRERCSDAQVRESTSESGQLSRTCHDPESNSKNPDCESQNTIEGNVTLTNTRWKTSHIGHVLKSIVRKQRALSANFPDKPLSPVNQLIPISSIHPESPINPGAPYQT